MKNKSQIPISKSQSNPKSQFPIAKFTRLVIGHWILIGYWILVIGIFPLFAQEFTILYTGETHAMLYPCSCPKEPDGGISRRATLLKQLRKTNPEALLLDSGNFFAGGLLDEYTQNTQADMQRTAVNLTAMELMKYDAVTIGDAEFNFGRDFLEKSISKANSAFLSCNVSSGSAPAFLRPYIIKEVKGIKFGITGVTALSAMQKAGELKFIEPKLAVKKAAEELKAQGAEIIILLSNLEENENLNLINNVEGIDILILGNSFAKKEPSAKIGATVIVRPAWQARKLGKLSFTVADKKIADYKIEEIRLSDKLSDDPQMLSILPRCFSDTQCKQKGLIGLCHEAGTLNSRCLFTEATKINLLVITPKTCRVCDPEKTINYLKTQVPGLAVSYLYYPDKKADKFIKDFDIKGLPAYLFGKEIEKEKTFASLRENLEAKGDYYLLKPQAGGISYFLAREEKEGNLDVFMSLFDKHIPELLNLLKDFLPTVHFLAIPKEGGFDAAKGNLEIEEYLRAVCVQEYYPQKFWDYISCRGGAINSSWWEDCLPDADAGKIKNCSRSDEGKTLLHKNIRLNAELQIMFGPTYLMDNREVFGFSGMPTKEEFKKILNKK